MRYILACVLALGMGGCSWFEKQSFEVCVVYKGKEICAKKINGVWSFSANLTKEEQDQIIKDIDK